MGLRLTILDKLEFTQLKIIMLKNKQQRTFEYICSFFLIPNPLCLFSDLAL